MCLQGILLAYSLPVQFGGFRIFLHFAPFLSKWPVFAEIKFSEILYVSHRCHWGLLHQTKAIPTIFLGIVSILDFCWDGWRTVPQSLLRVLSFDWEDLGDTHSILWKSPLCDNSDLFIFFKVFIKCCAVNILAFPLEHASLTANFFVLASFTIWRNWKFSKLLTPISFFV